MGDLGVKMRELFELARPYLENNSFGVAHTQRVFDFATRYFSIPIQSKDKVHAIIILHDIGGISIKDQYAKGPIIAEKLLRQIDYDDKTIREICEIIGSHHEKKENASDEFKILYDADQLAKFSKEEFASYDVKNLDWNSVIESMYFEHSKKLARKTMVESKKIT